MCSRHLDPSPHPQANVRCYFKMPLSQASISPLDKNLSNSVRSNFCRVDESPLLLKVKLKTHHQLLTYFQKLVYNPASGSEDKGKVSTPTPGHLTLTPALAGEARGAGLGVWRRRWRTFVTQVYRVFCL